MSLPQTYNLLKKHLNPVYIETGIWRGDSLQMALDAGFKTIIGIDNDPDAIEFCKRRFDKYAGKNSHIQLHLGSSPGTLYGVLRGLDRDTPVTFLLDAHWQMLEGTDPGILPFPLLEELRAIGIACRSSIDTIIIDDMLIMQDNITGYNKQDIENTLYELNYINYSYIANPVINNMLVATP